MTTLARIPVNSSMLSAVAYDEKEQILYAEFANTGKVYAYEEVEKEVFEELLAAQSVGSYFRDNILDCYGDWQVKRGRDFKW